MSELLKGWVMRELCKLARKRVDVGHGVDRTATASGKMFTARCHVDLDEGDLTCCVETCGDVLTVYTPEWSPNVAVRSSPVDPMFTERDGQIRYLFKFDMDACTNVLLALQRDMPLDALSDV